MAGWFPLPTLWWWPLVAVANYPQTKEFITRVSDLLMFLLPFYIAEGKTYLSISIGCTGGHHRSVMMAEEPLRAHQESGLRR